MIEYFFKVLHSSNRVFLLEFVNIKRQRAQDYISDIFISVNLVLSKKYVVILIFLRRIFI